jgi:hypothetical protein
VELAVLYFTRFSFLFPRRIGENGWGFELALALICAAGLRGAFDRAVQERLEDPKKGLRRCDQIGIKIKQKS